MEKFSQDFFYFSTRDLSLEKYLNLLPLYIDMVKQRFSNYKKAKKYTKIVNMPEGIKVLDVDLRSLTIKLKQDKFLGKTYNEKIDLPGNLYPLSMVYRESRHDVLIKYIKKDDLTISALSKLYS